MNFKDLEDYGIIGNLETCALVGNDGSVDWLCFPYLGSPSVFAKILDSERGGHFWIKPLKKFESIQSYLKNTNILQTKFKTPLGEIIITDFMNEENRTNKNPFRAIFRKVECTKGNVELEISFKPRFQYAKVIPSLKQIDSGIAAQEKEESLFFQSSLPLKIQDGEATEVITLSKGKTLWFSLQYGSQNPLSPQDCEKYLSKVKKYWLGWKRRCNPLSTIIDEPWHDLIVRSGLILKLLANPETGAIAAAPTTSLPENIGGVRNWDYRFAWIRDASFTVQALFHLGHVREAREFYHWIEKIVQQAKDPSKILIMYGLNGETNLAEKTLENLSGYKNSSPVRIGNDAAKQKQLDIFGELVNAIYETSRNGEEISAKTWQFISRIVDYVCTVWNTTDSGIWEVRGAPRHFVYSKLMCWVAVDRGIKISELKKLDAPLAKWQKTRDEISQTILEKGFNNKLNSFVQSFDSDTLDATSLLIPLMGFLPFDDPKIQGTIDATLKRLMTKDGLVYRYEAEDGLPGTEGNFVLCSFWLVKALALSNRVAEAEKIFNIILDYLSPLGLLAEEIDPKTDKQLGNFPQAFSHVGLINSALYLGVAKGKKHTGPKLIGLS